MYRTAIMRSAMARGLLLVALVATGASSSAAAGLYTTTILPAGFVPTAINSSGELAGFEPVASSFQAVLYDHGTLTPLGTAADHFTYTTGLNDSGQVVGYSASYHALLYSGGTVTDLSAAIGAAQALGAPSQAAAINSNGTVVGYAGTFQTPFRYAGGTMSGLGLPAGFSTGAAVSINATGQIAVNSVKGLDDQEAFVDSGGTFLNLGSLTPSAVPVPSVSAAAINNPGQVAGTSLTGVVVGGNTVYVNHAFLWTAGSMTDLSLGVADSSHAFGMNNHGAVVGTAGSNNSFAFLYQSGGMQNLNQLIDPAFGHTLLSAGGINDAGQIFVSTTDGAYVLLTPIHALLADVNDDGVVNGLDIAMVASHWLQSTTAGDANGDGVVNGLDIALIASNWLHTLSPGGGAAEPAAATMSSATTSVPEPTSLSLATLASVAIAAGIVSRRKQR